MRFRRTGLIAGHLKTSLTTICSKIHFSTGVVRLRWCFAVVLLMGVVGGAVIVRSEIARSWIHVLAQPGGGQEIGTFQSFFARSLQTQLVFFTMLFLAGSSYLGGFLVPPLLFFRGLGIGMALGYLYQPGTNYAWFMEFVRLFPHNAGTSVLLIIQARESFSASSEWLCLNGTDGSVIRRNIRRYVLRSGMILLGYCGCALLDAAMSCLVYSTLILN